MTSSKAKKEFEIRYYFWALSEFKQEIDRSFDSFRSFKAGSVWKLNRFMGTLDTADQLLLAHALLKRFHPDAVRTLAESCSAEEKHLRARLDGFRQTSSGPELEIAERKRAGERLKFLSKRKLLTITADTFQSAFDGCVESGRDEDNDPSLRFEMRSCGWVIYTNFWFGRSQSLIDYCHGIATERVFEQRGAKGSYHAQFSVGFMISFCSWLGISSQTQWEYLQKEDVPIACDALIKHCACFFNVAPMLLKGLEIDSISEH